MLITLDCDIEYDYHKACVGGSYPDTGEIEIIPGFVELKSIKYKGIELINQLDRYEINQIECEILESNY